MITIDRYISNLLYMHDCVIVPGLGGFVANHRPVEIRESHHLFLPPAKEIGFNRSLSYNDGLLASYIARKESVSYVEAVNLIEKFVSNTCAEISSGKTVDLGEAGSLRKDAIGNILFLPKDSSSFLPDSMGLDSFRFIPLEQKRITRIEFQDDYILNPVKHKLIRNWMVAVSLAVCFTFFSVELKMPSVSQAGVGKSLFTYWEDYTEYLKDDVIENEKVFEQIVSSAKEENIAQNYHLIGGSFKHIDQANRALSEYQKGGFGNAAILNNNSGHIRISLCAFPDKEKALEKLGELRQEPRFSTIWILSANLNDQ